jgi:heparanase
MKEPVRFPGVILALALVVPGCGQPSGSQGPVVDIETASPVAEVAPEFLSFTFDTDLIVAKRHDLSSRLLVARARALAPAILRVGGTKADGVHYDLGATPVTEAPPPDRWVLDAATFDGLCGFVRQTGLELMFNVSAGPGARDAEMAWTDTNARELVDHAVATGCPVTIWELGNEPGAWLLEHGFSIDGAAYARDFARFRSLIQDRMPAARVAGPAVAYWPALGEVLTRVLEGFLTAADGGIDIVTWHYYPQQSRSCPVHSRPIADSGWLDVAGLDEIATWAAQVEGWAARYSPEAEVWLGETGHAQCGGEPGVSDRFVTGLWWLDQLGLIARRGQRVVFRQALVGGAYTLLDPASLAPRPDYVNSALWKRLMGTRVLAATARDAPDSLRVYAHCTPRPLGPPGAVTLLAINNHLEDELVFAPAPALGRARLVYQGTAPALLGEVVFVNEVPASFDAESRLVLPPPWTGAGPLIAPAASYTFVVFPDAGAQACREP